MIRKCEQCNKEFKTIGNGKFCSHKCFGASRKGIPRSDELKEKVRKSLLGRPSPQKGKKRPEFSGEKHPMWGKHFSEEIRQKMRKPHRKFSEEIKQKLSKIRKGKKHKPHSEETKRKISEAHKGLISWRKGKTRFKSEQEKREAMLLCGRKSYRKHIKTRLFYYRQLSHKRRMAIGNHTLEQWEELKKKYNYCCVICGMQEPFTDQRIQKLTEDHIIPISKKGTNYIENIQPLCLRCNSKKYNK